MRRTILTVFVTSVAMAIGGAPALASGSSGSKGSGKPCPKSSPAGTKGSAPNCGKGQKGKKGKKGKPKKCPKNSPNAGGRPPCGKKPTPKPDPKPDPDPKPEPPAGNCALADLVVFENAKIVCLYLGENAANASKAADCPDALLAVPVSPLVGACVFLPPETGDNASGGGGIGLPPLPPLPSLSKLL